jgi:CpeT protein
MKQKSILLSVLFLAILSLGCKHNQNAVSAPSTEEQGGRRMSNFQFLRQCMIGDFSSALQAKTDSDFFDIRLRMVPIWSADESTFYLYVEQAVASSLDKPYRQRIYKVTKDDNTHFTSYIYTVSNPLRLAGKNADDALFTQLTPDSLTLKDGCEVKLEMDIQHMTFAGSTGDRTCPSDRSGAAWATSKVTIDETKMISWDQGWNTNGKQVWGAVKGGYIFLKQ